MQTKEIVLNGTSTTVVSGGADAPAPGTVETWTLTSGVPFGSASASVVPPTQTRIQDPAAPSEIMLITDVTGNVATVTRAVEGTTAVPHAIGFVIQPALTAGSLAAEIEQAIALFDGGTKNANFIAIPNGYYAIDTTSNAVTGSLPATPADGTIVEIAALSAVVSGGVMSHSMSLAATGSDHFNTATGGKLLTATSFRQKLWVQYIAELAVWKVRDSIDIASLRSELNGTYAQGRGTGTAPAAIVTGPVMPNSPALTTGTEYVWLETDGAGNLLDILSGVA